MIIIIPRVRRSRLIWMNSLPMSESNLRHLIVSPYSVHEHMGYLLGQRVWFDVLHPGSLEHIPGHHVREARAEEHLAHHGRVDLRTDAPLVLQCLQIRDGRADDPLLEPFGHHRHEARHLHACREHGGHEPGHVGSGKGGQVALGQTAGGLPRAPHRPHGVRADRLEQARGAGGRLVHEVLLAGEIVVDGRLGDPGLRGDVAGRGAHTVAEEDLRGRVEDGLSAITAAWRAARPAALGRGTVTAVGFGTLGLHEWSGSLS